MLLLLPLRQRIYHATIVLYYHYTASIFTHAVLDFISILSLYPGSAEPEQAREAAGGTFASIFHKLQWSEPFWPEAELEEVVLYLRTSKNIRVPEEFKGLIPKYSWAT